MVLKIESPHCITAAGSEAALQSKGQSENQTAAAPEGGSGGGRRTFEERVFSPS
ncbi:MAG: hypothetical protein HUU31_18275 [Anaerolineae bacterium]|nr:hypothetical protein [Anaerolineae bacterium]